MLVYLNHDCVWAHPASVGIAESIIISFKRMRPQSNDMIKYIGNYSYEMSKCLGEGAFGKVYEGMSMLTQQKVAVKKIDLRLIESNDYLKNAINAEIAILKRFKHENIVEFIDFLASKNSMYLVMEFCEQGDLKRYLRKNPYLNETQMQEILKQIIRGFSQLNRNKITHRDLKPANVLVSNNTFKIADFGFAKHVGNFDNQMLRSCVGSPIYMSPQILAKLPYTTKSDIWSLGILAYEMFYKQVPWIGNSEEHLLSNIKTIPLKEQPGPTFKLIKKMLEFEEDRRIEWEDLFAWAGLKDKSQEMTQQVPIPVTSSPVPANKRPASPVPVAEPAPQNLTRQTSNKSPTSPRKSQPKKVETVRQIGNEDIWLVSYIAMDFFSKVRSIRKLCDNNMALDKVLFLLSRLMAKKAEGVSQKKLAEHLKDVNNDITDYLTMHRKYNALKAEFLHCYKEGDIVSAMNEQLGDLRSTKIYPQTAKIGKYIRAYSTRMGFDEFLADLRSIE